MNCYTIKMMFMSLIISILIYCLLNVSPNQSIYCINNAFTHILCCPLYFLWFGMSYM